MSRIATDGGLLWMIWVQAATAYWILFGAISLRRATAPTNIDLSLVRWSFVPLLLIAPFFYAFASSLRS
jgi:hypothetical protein